jgi:glucose-fructose oxidoreductase
LATSARDTGTRFTEVDEMTSAILRFPDDRLAAFTCSFGAADVSSYEVIGTEGTLRVDPAYEYVGKLTHYLTREGKTKKQVFSKRDQFAAELIYFSNSVLSGQRPEPCGHEGLADVRIIEALYDAAEHGRPVPLRPVEKDARPSLEQEVQRPPVKLPELVHTDSPSL